STVSRGRLQFEFRSSDITHHHRLAVEQLKRSGTDDNVTLFQAISDLYEISPRLTQADKLLPRFKITLLILLHHKHGVTKGSVDNRGAWHCKNRLWASKSDTSLYCHARDELVVRIVQR